MASILHASDFHFGAKYKNYPPSYRELLEDYQKQCLTKLIDTAVEKEVDAIVFAGDFFDENNPKESLVQFVENELTKLEEKGIKFILALGNHDYAFDQKRLESPSLVILPSDRMDSITFSQWTLYGISHQLLWDKRRPAHLFKKVDDKFSLGLFHSVLGGEREDYLPIDLAEIDTMAFDYLALGHIHRPMKLSSHCLAYYSGALCGDLYSDGGFYHYVLGEKEALYISSPPFPIELMHYEITDLQEDLLSIEAREKEEIYLILEGSLDAKEELMLEHWKKNQDFPIEVRTVRKQKQELSPLLRTCKKIIEEDLHQLYEEDYLEWEREEIHAYFSTRREELFEELLRLYQGENHD